MSELSLKADSIINPLVRLGHFRFSAAQFLAVLVLMLFLTPLVEGLKRGETINVVLMTLVLVSGVLAVGRSGWTIVLALLLMLTGCAQLPGSAAGKSEQRPGRAAIFEFALSGRIAIQRQESHYVVNLAWLHAPQSDEIMLTTPLGQGVAELTRNAAGMRLLTAEKREYTAPDWPALTRQLLGLDLPLASLPRWLVGAVATDALGVSYDGSGRLQQQLAEGWLVAYLEYESAAADALPTLVELRREDIEVKLKIDDWQLPR